MFYFCEISLNNISRKTMSLIGTTEEQMGRKSLHAWPVPEKNK